MISLTYFIAVIKSIIFSSGWREVYVGNLRRKYKQFALTLFVHTNFFFIFLGKNNILEDITALLQRITLCQNF